MVSPRGGSKCFQLSCFMAVDGPQTKTNLKLLSSLSFFKLFRVFFFLPDQINFTLLV